MRGFYWNNLFWVKFFRSVIRACTGSFANVYPGTSSLYIKVGQILWLSKNGSWALVDARIFFFYLLIRTCTGSFANVWTGTNVKNIKLGQIFGSSKNESWALVDACNFLGGGHELEHVQEALDICQNAKTLKTPTKVDCTAKMSIADLFLVKF